MKNFTLFFVIAILSLPTLVFSQGVVPCDGLNCQACHLVQLGQNVLTWFIGIMATFIAFVFVIGGLQMVMSGGSSEGIGKAKEMMTNAVVGFLILLASWLIVDTVLKTFIDESKLGVWNEVKCVEQRAPTAPTGPSATSTPSAGDCKYTLSQYSGPEETSSLVWTNTDSALQSCAAKELGSVSSAYRTPAYQSHLYALWDTWCKQGLQGDSTAACQSVKTSVSSEMSKHGLSCGRLVAKGSSNHAAGTAVDINGSGPQRDTACFTWFGSADTVHYTLKSSCYGDCNPNN